MSLSSYLTKRPPGGGKTRQPSAPPRAVITAA